MIFEHHNQKVHLWEDQSGKPFRKGHGHRGQQFPVNSLCRGNWNERTTLYTHDPEEVTCRICLSKMRNRASSRRFTSTHEGFNQHAGIDFNQGLIRELEKQVEAERQLSADLLEVLKLAKTHLEEDRMHIIAVMNTQISVGDVINGAMAYYAQRRKTIDEGD